MLREGAHPQGQALPRAADVRGLPATRCESVSIIELLAQPQGVEDVEFHTPASTETARPTHFAKAQPGEPERPDRQPQPCHIAPNFGSAGWSAEPPSWKCWTSPYLKESSDALTTPTALGQAFSDRIQRQ